MLQIYHQWPAFNPWEGGGLPFDPAVGYLSLTAVTTFFLGPQAGLIVMLGIYGLVGAWGFYRLGRNLGLEEPAAWFLAVFGTASPALAMHLAVGHVIFANLMVWPAIFSFLLDAQSDRWAGLKAGLLFALGFNELPYYVMQYGAILIGILWIWHAGRTSGAARWAHARFAFLAVVAAVPFMIPSIVGIWTVARDYARVANTPASYSISELAHWYLTPMTALRDAVYIPSLGGWWGAWEMTCYLGWGALSFFTYGLLRQRRWFHAFALGCFAGCIGNMYHWQPMHWLMTLPLFAPLQSFARLRLFTHVFYTIGVGWGISLAWSGANRRRRWIVGSLASLSLLEVCWVSHAIVRQAHYDYVPPAVVNERGGKFYQLAERRALPPFIDGWPADLSLYNRANIGIVRERAAIDSAFRISSRVKTANDADYVGELSQGGVAVAATYWSPNRIRVEGLNPRLPLTVNFNRGHPWQNFNQELFPNDRIVEFDKPFTVMPDARGNVDLTYQLPHARVAWVAMLACLCGSTFFCLYVHRQDHKGDSSC